MDKTFDGPDYAPVLDDPRLDQQHVRIKNLMLDGTWRTLTEIAAQTGDPAASISAQLRHLRKPKFGAWRIEKRSRGERKSGLFEYRLEAGNGVDERTHRGGGERYDSEYVRQLEEREQALEERLSWAAGNIQARVDAGAAISPAGRAWLDLVWPMIRSSVRRPSHGTT